MKTARLNYLLLLTGFTCSHAAAQNVVVEANVNRAHAVGGVSSFDRSKFITIHSSHTESDWDGGQQGYPNALPDLIDDFMNGRDVYFGRSTGGISWHRKGNANIDEDASNPGWVDAADMASQGSSSRSSYNSDTSIHPYEPRAATDILCAQYNGFWPNGDVYNGYAISTTDSSSEPFGSATGDFMGLYLDHFYDNFGAQLGRPSPPYVEIINEPDWHILDETSHDDYLSVPASKIWDFHAGVADAIRVHNTNSLIGGFVTTFPDPDEDTPTSPGVLFQEWEDEWKSFIDIAGARMDFWSLHLYDFPAKWSDTRYRKGANLEATFDMIDYYSEATLGAALPYVISEYGAQTHEYNNQGWSAYRDWLRLKSINSMLLTFMDRPHLMLKTIPFTVVKAEWGRGAYPYGPRLMRQENEPASATGDWIYTELVRFYDLWSDVNGERIHISSTDPDIQVDAYVDGDKVYVILNNIVPGSRTVDLSFIENHSNTVQSVYGKHLYWSGPEETGSVMLDETNHIGNLSQVVVESEGCMVLEYTMASAVNIADTMTESKYFATSYLQTIQSGVTRSFQITNVVADATSEAVLRLSIARAHALSKQPTVLVNGTAVTVPSDVMGLESDGRFQFFGTLLIPVPIHLIQSNNTVEVTFSDTGGHISTVALRIFNGGAASEGSIPIDYHHITGADIILGFTNGPANSWFSLFSKTNLMDALWTTNQTELPIDGSGAGSVTNPITAPQEFYRLLESAPPPPAGPTIIEFTDPDYSNGPLNGQQNWNAEAGWTVTDSASAGYAVTAVNNDAAVLNEPIQLNEGETYSLSINLQFGGGPYSTPTNYVYAFMGGLKVISDAVHVGTGDAVSADASIQIIRDTDNYRLLNNWTPTASQITTGTLDAGDILQFDYELTLGPNAGGTSYTVRLQNLTDGTDTGAGTVTGVHDDIYTALTGTGAFGFFQTINPGNGESGLSGAQVNAVLTNLIP